MKIMDNVRASRNNISAEVRGSKEAEKLKESCQQFESILVAEVWKKMSSISRKISGKEDKDRPFWQVEDLAVEMSAESISKSGGMGLWKSLYENMLPQLQASFENQTKLKEKADTFNKSDEKI